jgi:hypothetical protein
MSLRVQHRPAVVDPPWMKPAVTVMPGLDKPGMTVEVTRSANRASCWREIAAPAG